MLLSTTKQMKHRLRTHQPLPANHLLEGWTGQQKGLFLAMMARVIPKGSSLLITRLGNIYLLPVIK
jgi:hypothetical protein